MLSERHTLVGFLELIGLTSYLLEVVISLTFVPARTAIVNFAMGVRLTTEAIFIPFRLVILRKVGPFISLVAVVALILSSTSASSSTLTLVATVVVVFPVSVVHTLLGISGSISITTTTASSLRLAKLTRWLLIIRVVLSEIRLRTVTYSMTFFLTAVAFHGRPGSVKLTSHLAFVDLIILPAG